MNQRNSSTEPAASLSGVLDPSELANMSAQEFAALSAENLGQFTPEHVRCLTDEHLKVLKDEVLCEVWTSTQLNALSSSQAAVLARILYS